MLVLYNKMILISKIIEDIKEEDWKPLVLGLKVSSKLTDHKLIKLISKKRLSNSVGWISGSHKMSYQNKVKFIEYILRKNLSTKKLIKKGKIYYRGIQIRNEIISINKYFNKDDFKGNLIFKEKDNYYIHTPLLFPKYYNKNLIRFIPHKNKLIIYYYNKRNSKLSPLILPEYIDLNKAFMVGFGIYLAEGSKNRHPKITNSEPKIINQAISFFNNIGIRKHRLKAWIQLHERSQKNKKEVMKFWIEKTFLNKDNITTFYIKKSSGNAKVKQYGVLHLETTFFLSQLLIKGLLSNINKILLKTGNRQKIWFLRGAFAGDGSVGTTKKGSLNMIRYTSTIKEERQLISNLLSNFNIKSRDSEKHYDVGISSYENLKKCVLLDIFKYHLDRKQKIENGFSLLNKNKTSKLNKNKLLNLLKETPTTSQELSINLNVGYNSIRNHLRRLHEKGNINKI